MKAREEKQQIRLRELPIPKHFDPSKVGEVWRVAYHQRAQEAAAWAKVHKVQPSSADTVCICLIVVDCQNTFCIPGFELFVAGRTGNGAVEDNVRLCEFIYRNLGVITEIAPTMDTHTAMQIFHPIFWFNDSGEHPKGAQTIISLEDVKKGVWKVNPDVAYSVANSDHKSLQRHVLHYVNKLTEGGKYPLMVWPYHSMLGGIGHALVSAVEEAIFFHCIARSSQSRIEIKGDNPLTEHYSVFSPEVLEGPNGQSLAEKNTRFIRKLQDFDVVIITGQAKSHCVAWTINDLLTEIMALDADLVRKVFILEDCTSPVVVPGVVDFTDQADAAFQGFADAGMHVVKSTEPMNNWPGIAP